jgi:predicted transcriptional regulator
MVRTDMPPKRTKTQRQEDLVKVAQMDRKGYTQERIAKEMGVCQAQICYDLKRLREKYAAQQHMEMQASIWEKVAQYRMIREEAWDAWERSKQDYTKEYYEKVGEPDGQGGQKVERLKLVKTVEGRLPNNEYMRTIVMCLEKESELLGLTQKQGSIQIVNMGIDALFQRQNEVDMIEQAIAHVGQLPQLDHKTNGKVPDPKDILE